jgi:hypothetical protein
MDSIITPLMLKTPATPGGLPIARNISRTLRARSSARIARVRRYRKDSKTSS